MMMISWLEDDPMSDNDDRVPVAQQPAPESLFPRVPCRVTFTTRLSVIEGKSVVSLGRASQQHQQQPLG